MFSDFAAWVFHSLLFAGRCGGWSQAIETQITCHLGVMVFEVACQFKESPRAWLFGSRRGDVAVFLSRHFLKRGDDVLCLSGINLLRAGDNRIGRLCGQSCRGCQGHYCEPERSSHSDFLEVGSPESTTGECEFVGTDSRKYVCDTMNHPKEVSMPAIPSLK